MEDGDRRKCREENFMRKVYLDENKKITKHTNGMPIPCF